LALLEVYGQTGETRYLEGAEAGLKHLLDRVRPPRPEDGDEGFLVVASEDVGSVGASALTLLALLEHRAVTVSKERVAEGPVAEVPASWAYGETMAGLARFLSFQEQADGEIILRYPYGTSRGGPFQAPFASATAALALLRYARVHPNGVLSTWFNDAERAAGWLMAVRDLGKTYDELPHDFRLLQALDELHELSGGGRTYYLHARRVAEGILETLEEVPEQGPTSCPSQTMARAAALVSVIRIARRAELPAEAYETALAAMLKEVLDCWERPPDDRLPSYRLRSDDAADVASLFSSLFLGSHPLFGDP